MAKRRTTKAPGTRPPAAGDGGPSVPAAMRAKYDAIWALVGPFCRDRLDDEYAALCQRALATLARKRPSPLVNGTAAGWAAGVVRAVGHTNFLDDRTQKPHAKMPEIDKAFGVSTATGQAKGKVVRDLLKMSPFAPDWTRPSKMADNPMAYLVSVNGLVMDARHAPPGVAEQAVARGLIPPLPRPAPPPPHVGPPRLYTVEAFIIQGPTTPEFDKRHPEVSRKIEIRGDQTLADLHAALFAAFDRHDEHLYEFQFGKGPNDPAGPRYVLPMAMADDDGDNPAAGSVETTTLDGLGLKVGRAFGYRFDFGDDWWHQVNVEAVADFVPAGVAFPRVVGRVGDSPPQYPDADEED